jgi:hypothetical protein
MVDGVKKTCIVEIPLGKLLIITSNPQYSQNFEEIQILQPSPIYKK